MREEARADRECSWVVHLNTAFHVIEKELTGMGSLFRVNASPREIFRKAIINGAYAIIQVHNHPSGNMAPSNEDIDAFRTLTKAGKTLGIAVYDCLIIGATGYYSFLEAARRGEEPVLACLHCG
jgi:DNA repair protein RadC